VDHSRGSSGRGQEGVGQVGCSGQGDPAARAHILCSRGWARGREPEIESAQIVRDVERGDVLLLGAVLHRAAARGDISEAVAHVRARALRRVDARGP